MMEQRFALPQRSPKPLMVPCTCTMPCCTAMIELATAQSPSLWVWTPSGTATVFLTTSTIWATSNGMVPPLVSHRMMQAAPPCSAAFKVFRAYSGFAL